MRMYTRASLLAAAALISACSTSPPAQFYTLQPARDARPSPAAPAGFQIEIASVSVPMQADQPQIMLRERATDNSLTPLYSHRWSAPLPDEIRSALSDVLTRDLGALNVQALQPSPGTPVWRVQVDVQRFDIVGDAAARLDATWRVRPVHHKQGKSLLCRTLVQVEPSGRSISELVQAQQQAVRLLADTIASAIRSDGARATPAAANVQLEGCNVG